MTRRGPGRPAFAAERHDQILRLLTAQGRVRTVELARDLDVAEPTIRKDIVDLAERGLLRRTYGGAIAATDEPTIAARSTRHVEDKTRIAQVALTMIESGESIYLDNGTTVLALAEALAQAPPARDRTVNVLTNGIEVAQTVVDVPGVRHVLLGGTYRRAGNAVTGPLAVDSLAQFSVSTAFLGVSGLADDWFTVADLAEAQVKSAVVRTADRVVVLMDSSKFGARDFARICRLDAVSCIVTDHAEDDWIARARAAGVDVRIA